MSENKINPNINPRPFHTWIAAKFVAPWLWLLRKSSGEKSPRLVVFESYSVGDLYIALPALKLLARKKRFQVLCRADCIPLIQSEGLEAVAFDNAFCIAPGKTSFFRSLKSAWNLRGRLGALAIDFDADTRTALWLKIAGVKRVVTYRRRYASLFDEQFPFPPHLIHAAEKDVAVVRAFLGEDPADMNGVFFHHPLSVASSSKTWLVSCWTRKDTKNWLLSRWDELLERMTVAGIPFEILDPPDGDAEYLAFRSRWAARAKFVSGSLTQVVERVKNSAGIIATDNFLGHMSGYYGKPVLWINGSSNPNYVLPKGPCTRLVQVQIMPCRPCDHRCVNPEYKACMKQLTADEVWKAFQKLGDDIASAISPAKL